MGRRDECPHCGADARVCLNCTFYDKGSQNECRESQVEAVQEKEQGNFCSYFEGRVGGPSAKDAERQKSDDALAQLFGGKKSTAEKPKSRLEEELAAFFTKKS